MKRLSWLFMLLLSLGAISSANAAALYEGVALPGTPKLNPSFFQINVATGQTTSVWSVLATIQIPVQEKAPPPAGEYHLFSSTNPQPDGSMTWMLTRLDAKSGRIWSLTGGGDAPLVWAEVTPPK